MSATLHILAVGNRDCIVVEDDIFTAVVDVPHLGQLRDWLEARGRRRLDSIFVTHDHHDHFEGLAALHAFAVAWDGGGRCLGRIYLPNGLIRRALDTLRRRSETGQSGKDFERLKAALEWASASRHSRRLSQIDAGSLPISVGCASFVPLWPTLAAVETWASSAKRDNELSLVLQVRYFHFTALLLADLEGGGLRDLAAAAAVGDIDVRADVVKIPHHGGWPTNGGELQDLLERVDPVYALLSVGSKNQHRHVRPQLFAALLRLKRPGVRFRRFACTEVTRTCLHTADERAALGKAGLSARQPCAGDLQLVVEAERWWIVGEEAHGKVIEGVPMAACQGKADLNDD